MARDGVAVEVREEGRRLGPLGKGAIAIGIVFAVGLAILSAVLAARRAKINETRENVEYLANELRARLRHDRERGLTVSPPPCNGKGWDEIGQSIAAGMQDPGYKGDVSIFYTYQFDAWGRWIVYRSPGPVHGHGWDFYSFGPNGIDELGQGDDILIGEDVALVASGG